MFGVKAPKLKTRSVAVPIRKASDPAKPAQSNGHGRAPNGAATAAPANRYKLSSPPRTKAAPAHASASNGRKSVTVKSVRKRKVQTYTPLSSDQESESEDDSADGRKRQKMSSSLEPLAPNRYLPPDYKRRIWLPSPEQDCRHTNGPAVKEGKDGASIKQENGTPATKARTGKDTQLINGRGICLRWEKEYKPAFPAKGEAPMVSLQYPSSSKPERFVLSIPRDPENFNPLEDIYCSIEEIVQHYLPADLAAELSSEADGTVRLLKRAVFKNEPDDFANTIDKFNKIIQKNVANGTIASVLDSKHAVPLSLVKRITDQVYSRTVSPFAHLLKKVKGKETTYGELLPPFSHTIFQQTSLNSQSVFVDLGSGVGNVVLQSALQTGAESHGIEIMDRAAGYANDQAGELIARAKLWNINLGPITLLHGDFLESPQIDEVLRRADVVLVNNKVFPPKLNNQLLDKFLDLKLGCKVVSLASFVRGGGKHGARSENSIANLFDEERYDSGTSSVSWAGESVEYFIMTKVR
ncbi:DOT1-domain-containing protein [Bimuria novae-zelandiae CBS 107.79]|uniref:Histone-lysine N-methyltransferase, H3 lysine-79 specific n=1 Tax=Bimuria novae-zelandiae CBS 107.79 TaxID=1447943 RepID=A0A6A5V490_9PLEO|nr:DOT1-domain-containing protein [Bimuria novae-zelandiae CBS 107.79]